LLSTLTVVVVVGAVVFLVEEHASNKEISRNKITIFFMKIGLSLTYMQTLHQKK
jgi:hypothetical protein